MNAENVIISSQPAHATKRLAAMTAKCVLVYNLCVTYTSCPEEVPSVLQHCVDIDELPLSNGDESAVSGVVVLQCTSYEDRICAGNARRGSPVVLRFRDVMGKSRG